MCGEANKVPPRAKNLDLSQDGRYVSGTHGGSETGPGSDSVPGSSVLPLCSLLVEARDFPVFEM